MLFRSLCGAGIQLERTEPAHRAAPPAQNRPQPADQLPRPEGLDDIVVRSGVKAGDRAGLIRPGGQHDDGRLTCPARCAADGQAVSVRQTEVDDRGVEIDLFQLFQRRADPGAPVDLPALPLEQQRERPGDGVLVL